MTINPKEAVQLAESYGGQRTTYRNQTYSSMGVVISDGNLAAMIADERRKVLESVLTATGTLETPANVKGRFQSELFWKGAYAMRDAIRARLEEGK